MTTFDPGRPRRTADPSTPRTVVPQTLTSQGFGVRGFGPLPDGFDPATATDHRLTAYRLPRRPDATLEPELRALWDKTLAATQRWVMPEFGHREHVSHGPPHRMRSHGGPVDDGPATGWTGGVDFAPTGRPYRYVGGRWTVPEPAAIEDGSHYTSEWVGLDGWNSAGVLQAGTAAHVVTLLFFRHTEVYAWWEWWPAGEVAVTNLPVSPGDVMYSLITADTAIRAVVTLGNLSQQVGTRFEVTAPVERALAGNAAEWMVERPATGGEAPSGDPFEECVAGDCTRVDDGASSADRAA